VKPAPFSYRRPASLEEATGFLSGEPDAKVLAGGQSLVPLLSMRLASPALLVDINGLPGLDHVTSDANGVRVGALARHSTVLTDPQARRVQPLLAMALSRVAHATIRNRGTTVGSLAHADAAAEMPAVLCLLGGSLDAVSPRGRRSIPGSELFVGPLETTLAHDEVAVEAFFPALQAGSGVAFDEVARRHGDYALCGVAAQADLDGDCVASARAAYLSVCDVPTVVDLTAELAGGHGSEELAVAGEASAAALDPQADIHATSEYRAQLIRVLTARVLGSAIADAHRRGSTTSTASQEGSHR
jgi:carbon-monoxide dehydrogenase medium subunit